MSDSGDYLDEMDRYRTSDEQIEELFSGAPDSGDGLEPLAHLFAALRTDFERELSDEAVAAMVAVASAATQPADSAITPVRSRPEHWYSFSSLRRRAATVTVAATVLLGGTSGLAVAADGATPGDTLYGIDRALEAVGIGAGGEQERLVEAEALIDTGQVARGLEHAADALDEDDATDSNASLALMEAAERVRAAGVEPSAVTRERVAGLLTYLAENTGRVDGRQVAELAVQIGRPDGRPDTPGSPGQADPTGPPANNPANPPGLTNGDQGPPDGVPASPPGQDKDKDKDKNETGPPEGVPANPPGQDKDKNEPGPPDSLPNN